MAIYEFRCLKCKRDFERMTTFDKKKEVVCPHCSSSDIKSIITTFSTKFSCPPSSTAFT